MTDSLIKVLVAQNWIEKDLEIYIDILLLKKVIAISRSILSTALVIDTFMSKIAVPFLSKNIFTDPFLNVTKNFG